MRGNAINRITKAPIKGNPSDAAWLWEEMNWGKPRPRGPVKIDKSDYDRIMLSFELMFEEIQSQVFMKTKEEIESKTKAENKE